MMFDEKAKQELLGLIDEYYKETYKPKVKVIFHSRWKISGMNDIVKEVFLSKPTAKELTEVLCDTYEWEWENDETLHVRTKKER